MSEKLKVELSYFECQRIVLALLQMNKDIPGTFACSTMRHLYDVQANLIARIDAVAAKHVEDLCK